MKARDQRLEALRSRIRDVAPAQAQRLQQAGAVLIDIRGTDEISQGMADGAVAVDRSFLELKIEDIAPDLDRTVLVMCGSGVRSLFAADALETLGYTDVRSVTGGFTAWKAAGLPFQVPKLLDAGARERYARQLIIPEIGVTGQQKLLDARILLVGAGGLGAPAALYLAAAGVGTIGLVDHDRVDVTNLQRQVAHSTGRVGEPKVESARAAIRALNPTVQVRTHDLLLSQDNAQDLLADYDLVIDGSDNFATRYLINDTCVRLGLPNVFGSVFRFDGQVSVFWPAGPDDGPCYRCLYPEPPPPDFAPSCDEAGVLGVLPGIIGLLEATEALKLVLGIGRSLSGRLLCFDALSMQFREFPVHKDPECACCGAGSPFPGSIDGASCHADPANR